MHLVLSLVVALALGFTALVLVAVLRDVRAARRELDALRQQLDQARRDIISNDVAGYQNQQALRELEQRLGLERPLPATRGWAASPDVLLVLVQACERTRARMIVECGSGVSTVVLARCAQRSGGHVYALEHEPVFAERTRTLLASFGLEAHATVIDAPLTAQRESPTGWYACASLPSDPIDVLFIDGPPRTAAELARYPAGPVLFPKLAPHGVAVLDDANRADERAILERWRSEFPDLAQRDHFCEKGCVSLEHGEAATRDSTPVRSAG